MINRELRNFLSLYYTFTSFMVPLALVVAYNILTRPDRYRTLFPHPQARQHALAGCLLFGLFFLPFLNCWVSQHILLLMGGTYAFIIVPSAVGLFKLSLFQQHLKLSKCTRRILRNLLTWFNRYLTSFVKYAKLFWLCFREILITLPYLYRQCISFQVLTNQVVFFLLAEKAICPKWNLVSLHLLLCLSVITYVHKNLRGRSWSRDIYRDPDPERLDVGQLASKVVAARMAKATVMAAVTVTFTIQVSDEQVCVVYLLMTSTYFLMTEPELQAEQRLTVVVSTLRSDILEQLEYLYVPLATRMSCVLLSTLLCLLVSFSQPFLAIISIYTNIYVPLNRILSEIISPLNNELKCLQNFKCPTKEDIERLGAICPVCLDNMNMIVTAKVTPCGHIFHSHCIRKCLGVSQLCPCCRTDLNIEESIHT